MSAVQMDIQKVTELISTDPTSEELGSQLYNLGNNLKETEYANSFLQQDGLTMMMNFLKSPHETIKRSSLTGFLNLMCHYSVLTSVINENYLTQDDVSNNPEEIVEIFCSLLTGIERCGAFGETDLIKSTMNTIAFFLQMIPQGIHIFRLADKKVSEDNIDSYKCFTRLLKDALLYKESLRLLQLIIRNSIMANMSEPIDRMVNAGIVKRLESLRNGEVERVTLSEADKVLIEEMLRPLDNSCSRVSWYIDTIKRQPTKKLIHDVISGMKCSLSKHDFLKIADDCLEDKLEEHLLEINENIEKEFARMSSSLSEKCLLGSPSGSPKYSSSDAAVSYGNESPVSTTTLQTITETKVMSSTQSFEEASNRSSTPNVFTQTLMDYLKLFFDAMNRGGGAPIHLEEIDQFVALPGKAHKKGIFATTPFRRKDKRDKKEERLYFLINVVSEKTARTLGLLYDFALCHTSPSDGQKLAEFALWKIIEGLREDHPKNSCRDILKSVTKNNQFMQKFLSYVCERPLDVGNIQELHSLYGSPTADDFFGKKIRFTTKSDAIKRINEIDSQLHQTRMTL